MARPKDIITVVCQNERCNYYLEEEGKNIIKKGKSRGLQRYFCQNCKTMFLETKGTPFYHKHLSKSEIIDIFKHLIRKKGIRSIERITGHHRDTIGQLLEDFVLHAGTMNSILLDDEELKKYGQSEIDKGWLFIKKIKRELSPNAKTKREKVIDNRIHPSNSNDKNIYFPISEFDAIVSALGLSQPVREEAEVVYRMAVKKNLVHVKNIKGVVAAVLYSACRNCNIPRTLDEISEVSRASRKEIGRTYKLISRELGLKLFPTSPIDYLPRFCSGLNLRGEVQSKAVEVFKQATEKELTIGKGPTGMAAAAIYIASILCGDRRTQREVAEVAGITEFTIYCRYKEMAEELNIEIIL